MGRIRTIKPELFQHELLFETEHEFKIPLRLAFAGLFCECDRRGRFKWRPRRLKLAILPYDDVDFSRVLDVLETRGFIMSYEVEGEKFGWIPTFLDHQVINNRESESVLPEPPEYQVIEAKKRRVVDACGTRHGEDKGEGNGREGNMEGNNKGADADASLQSGGSGLKTKPPKKKSPRSAGPPLSDFTKAEKALINCACQFGDFFIEPWKVLCTSKKWRGKESSAIEMSLNQLMEFDEAFAIDLVKKAIGGNYQGVVFPDTKQKFANWKNQNNGGKPTGIIVESGERDYGSL